MHTAWHRINTLLFACPNCGLDIHWRDIVTDRSARTLGSLLRGD